MVTSLSVFPDCSLMLTRLPTKSFVADDVGDADESSAKTSLGLPHNNAIAITDMRISPRSLPTCATAWHKQCPANRLRPALLLRSGGTR